MPRPTDLIKTLRAEELRLKRRHGLRVHIEKVSVDRSNVLCTAWRTAPLILQRRMEEYEIVDLVHEALRSLHLLGLRPLVGVGQKRNMVGTPPVMKADPFHLLMAMRLAEEAGAGSTGIPAGELERRVALLAGAKVRK